MATPPSTSPKKASNPFVQILDDWIPITSEQFTTALSGIAAVGVVWANWHRADGVKGFIKQAVIGASCGYGIARLLRDGVDSLRPPMHREKAALASIGNTCNLLERKLQITPKSSDGLPERLQGVKEGVQKMLNNIGTLQRISGCVKASLDAENPGQGTVMFALAKDKVEAELEARKNQTAVQKQQPHAAAQPLPAAQPQPFPQPQPQYYPQQFPQPPTPYYPQPFPQPQPQYYPQPFPQPQPQYYPQQFPQPLRH